MALLKSTPIANNENNFFIALATFTDSDVFTFTFDTVEAAKEYFGNFKKYLAHWNLFHYDNGTVSVIENIEVNKKAS